MFHIPMSPIPSIPSYIRSGSGAGHPAPYSVVSSLPSACCRAMATAETEHYKEDRTYIDCCVDWWYHFVNYQYAQKIGVSTLVLMGVTVTVFVSFQNLIRAPEDDGRHLRGETFVGPDTISARADIKVIYATSAALEAMVSCTVTSA